MVQAEVHVEAHAAQAAMSWIVEHWSMMWSKLQPRPCRMHIATPKVLPLGGE